MTSESINPDGRDIGPLANQLGQHGGRIYFVGWVDVPDGMQVQVFLPDDESKAEKCRQILADWNDRVALSTSEDW